MSEAFTPAVFDQFENRDEYLGFGYLGARRMTEPGTEELATVDAAVLDRAADLGLTEDQLFDWANSRMGRWFGDIAFGSYHDLTADDLADYTREFLF